jgi:hypothetical protein
MDATLPGDNLAEELQLYPTFQEKLRQMNLAAYILTAFLALLVAGNFVISCILILHYYSTGKGSVTGLISSALLVTPRVLAWVLNARASHTRALPLSMFSKMPLLPNTVDKDWKFKPEVYQPGLGVDKAESGVFVGAPASA